MCRVRQTRRVWPRSTGVYWTRSSKLMSRGGGAMAAKDRIGKASEAVRSNDYLKRLIEDEQLRENLLLAYGAARSAYGRMSNGKPASKVLFEDRKLQKELSEAAHALRDASFAIRQPPAKP